MQNYINRPEHTSITTTQQSALTVSGPSREQDEPEEDEHGIQTFSNDYKVSGAAAGAEGLLDGPPSRGPNPPSSPESARNRQSPEQPSTNSEELYPKFCSSSCRGCVSALGR